MAVVGEFVLVLAADTPFLCHSFCRQAHAHIDFRVVLRHIRVRANAETGHRNQTHRLRATCDNNIRTVRDDPLGSTRNGLQAAGTEPVNCLCRNIYGQASPQRYDTRHIQPLRPLRHGTAEDHVVNPRGIELALCLPQNFLDYRSSHLV